MLEGSRAFGVHYVYANLLGNEAGRAIYDGGAMIASAGQMAAVGPRFSFADWAADFGAGRYRCRTAKPRTHGQLCLGGNDEDIDNCVRVPFSFPKCEPSTARVERAGLGNAAQM